MIRHKHFLGLHKQTVNSAQGIGKALHEHIPGLEWEGQDPSGSELCGIISLELLPVVTALLMDQLPVGCGF